MVPRLERDTWPVATRLRQATDQYAPHFTSYPVGPHPSQITHIRPVLSLFCPLTPVVRNSDLVGMYAHENLVNLTRYALPLEEFVREEEERSARLAATLMPKYRACGERSRFESC